MRVVGLLLRIYSYIYHLVLSLVLLAIAIVTYSGGVHNLNLPMLPWKGAQLTQWVLGLGMAGLVSTILAFTGLFRFLFPVWCLTVVVLMVRGFFLSQYVYDGPEHFRAIVWLVAGAIGALLASLQLFKSKVSLRGRV